MKKIFIVLAVLLMAGPVLAASHKQSDMAITPMQPAQWRVLSFDEQAAIEKSIKEKLKDPASAEFRHSKYIANGKGEYCGYVNGKNSYGAYAGFTPFLVMLMNKNNHIHAQVIAFNSDDAGVFAAIKVCKELGYFK
ncbi:hypothetical protein ACQYRI_15540 [Salmonella enterica]